MIAGADRKDGERHTWAEPERGQSKEQLPGADGAAPRSGKDAGVLYWGS